MTAAGAIVGLAAVALWAVILRPSRDSTVRWCCQRPRYGSRGCKCEGPQ